MEKKANRSIDLGEYRPSSVGKMHGLLIAAIFFNALSEFVRPGYIPSVPRRAMRPKMLRLRLVCAALPGKHQGGVRVEKDRPMGKP